VRSYLGNQKGSVADVAAGVYDAGAKKQQAAYEKLMAASGDQNPYVIQKELGRSMSDNVTILRVNKRMKTTLALIEDLKNRYQTRLGMPDGAMWSNQSLTFTRAVWDMLLLSEAITKGAIARDESRGAHFKVPDDKADRHDLSLDDRKYPRDDEHWLKSTIVTCNAVAPDQFPTPTLSYEPVDISIVQPVARTYGKTTASNPAQPKPTTEPTPAASVGPK
jgi:succinate dehydrogenase / fumarate reductase flavoprotein subunit